MMVITAKLKKRNIIIALAAIAAILLIFLWPSGKNDAGTDVNGSTDTERVSFLNRFGWQVSETPVESQEVRIPKESNEIFQRYNELQKSQGYDLEKYAGKTVMRYVYEIQNHPDQTGCYRATVFVYNDHVIGGDVASTDVGGQMHGFKMPS